MKIHEQIKKYRLASNLSQEELAEKIYVSRQTISNWENEKNYPDINSLVLLSTLFEVSLDELVKGDLEEMNEQIKTEDVRIMKRDSMVYAILLIGCILLFVPMYVFFGLTGFLIWICIYAIAFSYALKLEKQKKQHNIQTYREIKAFFDGKKLDEIQKNQETGKRPYQTVLYVIGSLVVGFVVSYVLCSIIL